MYSIRRGSYGRTGYGINNSVAVSTSIAPNCVTNSVRLNSLHSQNSPSVKANPFPSLTKCLPRLSSLLTAFSHLHLLPRRSRSRSARPPAIMYTSSLPVAPASLIPAVRVLWCQPSAMVSATAATRTSLTRPALAHRTAARCQLALLAALPRSRLMRAVAQMRNWFLLGTRRYVALFNRQY